MDMFIDLSILKVYFVRRSIADYPECFQFGERGGCWVGARNGRQEPVVRLITRRYAILAKVLSLLIPLTKGLIDSFSSMSWFVRKCLYR